MPDEESSPGAGIPPASTTTELRARPFVHGEPGIIAHSYDYAALLTWYAGHQLVGPKPEQLPKLGYIVDDVAACFANAGECGVYLIDGLIANPDAAPRRVYEAVALLTETIVAEIASQGGGKLFAWTRSTGVAVHWERKIGKLEGSTMLMTAVIPKAADLDPKLLEFTGKSRRKP